MIPDDATPDLAGTLDPAAHLGAAIVRRQAAETTFNRTRSYESWCELADARSSEIGMALSFGFAQPEQPDPNLEQDFEVDDVDILWGLW
jgi:hypothetical protein